LAGCPALLPFEGGWGSLNIFWPATNIVYKKKLHKPIYVAWLFNLIISVFLIIIISEMSMPFGAHSAGTDPF
jgi:hypothetical protein